MAEESNPVAPTWLRSQCGHDSRSVKGCGHCEAADELERLTTVYQREREAHAANLKEQQKCEAERDRLRAIILAARRNGSIPQYPGDVVEVRSDSHD